jgi:hypothetical protein
MVTMSLTVDQSIMDSIRQILDIARRTLQEQRTHLPTAILHTWEGMFPLVLPFKDDSQKKALVDFAKEQVREKQAYAVTTVTVGRIVSARTGDEEECLVVATVIQPGRAYVITQQFFRDELRNTIELGELREGDDAVMPGQMAIFPAWDHEICH